MVCVDLLMRCWVAVRVVKRMVSLEGPVCKNDCKDFSTQSKVPKQESCAFRFPHSFSLSFTQSKVIPPTMDLVPISKTINRAQLQTAPKIPVDYRHPIKSHLFQQISSRDTLYMSETDQSTVLYIPHEFTGTCPCLSRSRVAPSQSLQRVKGGPVSVCNSSCEP
jgi:hypothetical protein